MDDAIAAAVVLVAQAGVAALCFVTTRRAARGQLGPNGFLGIRTPATRASPEAWRRGHGAAMLYARYMPWTAGGCAVLGVVGWILAGPAAALTVGLVGLASAVFLVIFAAVFAQLAAKDVR
ncbi:SdpI family protein [Brevibacterium sp. BRM-1]|uniref:SdpI family protein n=1 Tax=Brevibacterium sp. BRM-1 TaxID=2999062 RepID=UPI00227F71AD|nr:SdpI family protein [Brevibacterium sp. BRM-1]WAL39868.1 SdpI family protein [Brevibacterium sp. BRM-1]